MNSVAFWQALCFVLLLVDAVLACVLWDVTRKDKT